MALNFIKIGQANPAWLARMRKQTAAAAKAPVAPRAGGGAGPLAKRDPTKARPRGRARRLDAIDRETKKDYRP